MDNIINPLTKKSHSIYSDAGLDIIKSYIKAYVHKGGFTPESYEDGAEAAYQDTHSDFPTGPRIVKWTCEKCDGDGVVECDLCSENNNFGCEVGSICCWKCKGYGEIQCSYCNSMELRSRITVGCRYCNDPNNPKQTCEDYGIDPGMVLCPECIGENKDPIISCTNCDESGKLDCNICEGHGYTLGRMDGF